MSDVTPSGPVPRELVAGVLWDAKAEERYQERAAIQQHDGNMTREDAEREALWSVEAELHRFFVRDRVFEGQGCSSPQEKRDLVARWTSLYGEPRTTRLVAVLKDPKQTDLILREASWRRA
jgi:hypothetical protein